MSRRWYDVDYAVAQIQMGNAPRPMIPVFMGVHDEQGKRFPVLARQKGKDRLRQRHLIWIRDSAGVDQKCLLRSNEQVEKICLRVGARILSQDESLWLVGAYLQRKLR